MKITTFETAKVGDKVWCLKSGWGEIQVISPFTNLYPILVYFPNGDGEAYTLGGLHDEDFKIRTLFWDEVVIEAPEKPLPDLEIDTKVIVWNSDIQKTKRHFSHFSSSGRIKCFDNGMTSWTTEYTSPWDNWELAE